MTISNLTYAERARFADNVELRDVLETCADQEAVIERLDSLCENMLDVLKWVTRCLENPHGGMDQLAAIEKARDIINQTEES